MGSHIFGFFGVTQFFAFTVSKRTKMFVLQMKSKVFFIQSKKKGRFVKIDSDSILGSRKLQIYPKVTKMGYTIGHRIVIIGVGALRCQRHIPSKN